MGDTSYQQLDLRQLAKNILQNAQQSGASLQQAEFFAMEGTSWARQVENERKDDR